MPPAGILSQILDAKRREVADARARVPEGALVTQAREAPPARDLAAALAGDGARIRAIAEVKRRSPSAGWIREGADAVAIASAYRDAGAAAISVLTDREFFGGSLHDLSAVRAALGLPVLRKDFLVDPYQVLEARAAGADAILLIVAALDDPRLRELLAAATAQGMTALVEVHDDAEADRAVTAGAKVIGVNHRNLATFAIDMTLTARLRARVPRDRLLVGESGIRTAADVRALRDAGADAILVGETLMKSNAPGDALRELLT
jgi:indole-3-glycerol phosphate synthase